ncbi:hypothetical protein TSUD_216170 [Trifolium subterraneum]|uniref:Uncharacterized protein n=1 Tax=Trifolium subterraneum TaxID=3900 RepID=A0A2Z6MA51_TRISU|nr:hypothetical protein TSUD_216170 [Trifolium subterraneum]
MGSKVMDISHKLLNLIGDFPVKKFPELLKSESNGVSVVAVWFNYVLEGVDMWFNDGESNNNPRVRVAPSILTKWNVSMEIHICARSKDETGDDVTSVMSPAVVDAEVSLANNVIDDIKSSRVKVVLGENFALVLVIWML